MLNGKINPVFYSCCTHYAGWEASKWREVITELGLRRFNPRTHKPVPPDRRPITPKHRYNIVYFMCSPQKTYLTQMSKYEQITCNITSDNTSDQPRWRQSTRHIGSRCLLLKTQSDYCFRREFWLLSGRAMGNNQAPGGVIVACLIRTELVNGRQILSTSAFLLEYCDVKPHQITSVHVVLCSTV